MQNLPLVVKYKSFFYKFALSDTTFVVLADDVTYYIIALRLMQILFFNALRQNHNAYSKI